MGVEVFCLPSIEGLILLEPLRFVLNNIRRTAVAERKLQKCDTSELTPALRSKRTHSALVSPTERYERFVGTGHRYL